MAGIDVPAVSAALTVDGGADGSATLTSGLGFRLNAHAWLTATGQPNRECAITAVAGPVLHLRFVGPTPSYGNSDLSAYTVSAGAALSQPVQFVYGATAPAITDLLTTDGATVFSSGPIQAPSFVATGSPTNPTDLATKAYVDATAYGLDIKASCRAATTASIANLSSASVSVDGVTLAAGDRLLVKDGASADGVEAVSAKRNGVYVVGTVGGGLAPLTRAADADASAEVTSGLFAWVTEGTANGGGGQVLITADPITLNTTLLTFTEFTGTYRISVGTANGLSISGNALSLAAAGAAAAGAVTAGTQTLAGNKTFSGSISASNLSGTNTGDLTLATVGSTPANAGASLSGQVLTLQPADATHAGAVSTAAQTFAGEKTFSNGVASNLVEASSASSVSVAGAPTDASNAVGVVLSSSVSLATSGAKIAQFKNGSTEKAYVDKDGGLTVSGVASGSNAIAIPAGTYVFFGDATMRRSSSGTLAVSDGAGDFLVGNVAATTVRGQSANPLLLDNFVADGAAAVGCKVRVQGGPFANAAARLIQFENPAGTAKSYFLADGTLYAPGFKTDFTDSSGTPGNATINKSSGRSAFASAASSVVVTNSLVTASSIVIVQLETSGIGVGELSVVPAAGSFTVTSINALGVATVVTGTAKFSWFVVQS